MPRKPQFESPVRQVRKALGKTQTEFARTLGVSRKYVQKIELGERPLTDDLADFFMAAFGVTQSSVRQRDGQVLHLLGDYTHRDLGANIRSWQIYTDLIESWTGGDLHHYFLPKLDVLFDAARRKKQVAAYKYPRAIAISLRLNRWIDQTVDDFGLRQSINMALAEREKAGKPVLWEPSLILEGARNRVFLPSASKMISRLRRSKKTRPLQSQKTQR
jgi:transcriptional regulator with XRE-family HTH domain